MSDHATRDAAVVAAEGRNCLNKVLVALEAMDDSDLRAVIVRAQCLLMDSAVPSRAADPFTVEIVDHTEGTLLHGFRALDAVTQCRVSTQIGRLVSENRRKRAASLPLDRQRHSQASAEPQIRRAAGATHGGTWTGGQSPLHKHTFTVPHEAGAPR